MSRPQKLQETLPGLWRVFRHFWPWIRRQRALIAGSLLALFAGIALRLLEPWPLKFVFDQVIPSKPSKGSSAIPFISSLDPATLLILAAVGIVAITAIVLRRVDRSRTPCAARSKSRGGKLSSTRSIFGVVLRL